MTKEEALFSFWKSFGLPAFPENNVPTDPVKLTEFIGTFGYPYITYQVVTDSFGSDVALTASIWDKDRDGYSAFTAINAKKNEISRHIGPVGCTLPIDGGKMWIRRGHPFSQMMSEPSDDSVKRSVLSIVAEFCTNN